MTVGLHDVTVYVRVLCSVEVEVRGAPVLRLDRVEGLVGECFVEDGRVVGLVEGLVECGWAEGFEYDRDDRVEETEVDEDEVEEDVDDVEVEDVVDEHNGGPE